MFSNKQNVIQTVAFMKASGISHVVISPGSRNAPIIQSFLADSYFKCYSIVDERSASFFAIGLIYSLNKPVILCCTSGTALVNYSPAVAESFYQNLPLVVISADRSGQWIDQMDGQTINQVNVFSNFIRASVNLPEIENEDKVWYCNRLLNEVSHKLYNNNKGPVHINIPISEPLFDFSVKSLPEVRQIKRVINTQVSIDSQQLSELTDIWNRSKKIMFLAGQQCNQDSDFDGYINSSNLNEHCIILAEHLSNLNNTNIIKNFDQVLSLIDSGNSEVFKPDLLITFGGHVVSKRIKNFLRQNKPQYHWHFSVNESISDTYKSLTHLVNSDITDILRQITYNNNKTEVSREFISEWHNLSHLIKVKELDLPFSDLVVTGAFLKKLSENATLIVANSSSVRNIQLFDLDKRIKVFCNRGTNGIEGAVSTALGYSTVNKGITYLLIGDLSFFYDLNALWNHKIPDNLRILLINNQGGGIFHLLPGLTKAESSIDYIDASHCETAEKWVAASGIEYLTARNDSEMEVALDKFVNIKREKAVILEVLTVISNNIKASELYNNIIKEQK